MQRNEVRTKKWFSQLSSWAVLRIAHKKRDGLAITQQVQFARVTWFAFVSVFFIFCVKCKCNHLTFKDREQKLCSKLLISKMTTRLGATPKGAADKANFPLAPILGPQFILCLVSQPPSGTMVWAVRLPYRPLATPCLAPRGERRGRGGHIGPTLAPEAILFESPCRAHSETKIAQILCQGRDFNHLFYYS